MKATVLIIFAILILTILSCRDNKQTKNSEETSTVDTLLSESEDRGNKIDYDNTEVLQTTYVVDRNGTEIKQQSDENSKTLGTYGYGTRLQVIEVTEKWVGVRDRISREFLRNGSKVQSSGWEKVYVLRGKTGSISEITLLPADLNVISSITRDQKTEYFETEKRLEDFLKIELIDQGLFDSKRSSGVDFLLRDTAEIKKKNGIIELTCRTKVKQYVDKPHAELSMQVFNYVGQFEFLNKYLLSRTYYEGSDYKLIDKTNGEETQTFGEYPNISTDKKHIICIYSNGYRKTADLELYSIDDNQIKLTISASFKNWMPIVEPKEMFWSDDGYLFLTVTHVNSFWKADGNQNDKGQCISIKIL